VVRIFNAHELDKSEFIEQSVTFYKHAQFVHPFREGNTRSLKTFLNQIAKRHSLAFD
jgi:fido (protein-threonine AMPylation protein)